MSTTSTPSSPCVPPHRGFCGSRWWGTGGGEYVFDEFDLDLAEFRHTPISTELIRQNLVDARDAERDASSKITFAAERPVNCIVQILREKPVIDYEQCGELIVKLVQSVCQHYTKQYGYEDMRNIVMMYRQDIAGKIYKQMMQHFHKTEEDTERAVRDFQSYSGLDETGVVDDT